MAGSERYTPDSGAPGILDRIEASAFRFPFTLSILALIALAGWLTQTASGVQLGAKALSRFGFAPADTASFNLLRAVMSAFVTNGPFAFWTALVAVALFAGLSELRSGSLRTSIAFWGSHLIVLVLSWALLASLHLVGSASAGILYLARDVGPSAGYVGCLGYLLWGLRGRVRPSCWRSESWCWRPCSRSTCAA